jgi:hypothetical protein
MELMERHIILDDEWEKNLFLGSVVCPTCYQNLNDDGKWFNLTTQKYWSCTDICCLCKGNCKEDKFVKITNPRTIILNQPLHPKVEYHKGKEWWIKDQPKTKTRKNKKVKVKVDNYYRKIEL